MEEKKVKAPRKRAKKAVRSRAPRKSAAPSVISTGEKRQLELLGGVTVASVALIIAGIFFASSLQKVFLASPQIAAVVSSVLVELANIDRTNLQLRGLSINPQLTEAAQLKANDMAQKGYFSHESPEGYDSWHWFQEVGYAFSYAGENLAVDFSESADVESAWMKSPTHRANILDPHFTEIGIATAVGTYQGRPTVFAVQMFGAPARAAATPSTPVAMTSPSDPSEIAVARTEERPVAVLGETSETPQSVLAHNGEVHEEAALPAKPERPLMPIGAITKEIPAWGYLLSSPRVSMQYAYIAIGICILLALAVETSVEFRLHHVRRASVAALLLVVLGTAFMSANSFVFKAPIVDRGGTYSASAAEAS